MVEPLVTIVVVPRERFSYTRQSLESIYEHTKQSFSLVYVDGNSPSPIREYLRQQAEEKSFRLIRTDRYLAPNQARNLGLAIANTKYIVFIDNDVYVEPGWLKKLVNCAEESNATIVAPLVCIGAERRSKVHLAGGEARIIIEVKNETVSRKVHKKLYHTNCLVAEVKGRLQRFQCEFAEFHCMLVRTDIFSTIGQLDEKLLGTREHIDLCLTVTNAGGEIYCEPDSVVTYVPAENFVMSDIPYFQLRWSDRWELDSIKHFAQKWNVSQKDRHFTKRYQRLGHRRHQALLRPLIRQLCFGGYATWLEKLLVAGERQLNQYLCDRYQEGVKN